MFTRIITLLTFFVVSFILYGYLVDCNATANKFKENRLMGSTVAVPNAYPYSVVVLTPWIICSGALISNLHILTVASCLDGEEDAFVILGAYNRLLNETGQFRTLVLEDQFIIHENWDLITQANNIAMIRLLQAVTFSNKIQAISLPSRSHQFDSFYTKIAIATGWGHAGGNTYEDLLRYLNGTILSPAICKHYYSNYEKSLNLCIDGVWIEGACYGDEGGPLAYVPEPTMESNSTDVKFSKEWILIGIYSHVFEMGCTFGWPTVYTGVVGYLDWIHENSGISIND